MSKQFLVFGGILIMMCIVFAEPLPEPEKRETHLRKSPNHDLRGFLALVRNRRAEGDCGDTNDQCTFEQDNCCTGLYCKSSMWSGFCSAIKQDIMGDSETETASS
ncbi:uncharacterized protein [Littorina saxatilis]|uniref:uncharacterized protein isoform X1 n=1 Tax=Littorina saxatilis TaxID=31220 RepID=UPI0038B5EF09